MFTYLLGLIPVIFFFADPIYKLFSPSTGPQIRRLPRPELNTDLLALEDGVKNYTCPPDHYKVYVYSRHPLVLYIEDFLSQEERKHLLKIRCVDA